MHALPWPKHGYPIRLDGAKDGKQRLQSAVGQIAPVRNEIAHVREVNRDRLLRASVACTDVLEMLNARVSRRITWGVQTDAQRSGRPVQLPS